MAQRILELRVSHKGIKPVRNGHPWIFKNTLAGAPRPARTSASLERVIFGPEALCWEHSSPALIGDATGEPIGWGVYNPRARLAVRVMSRTPERPFTAEVLREILVRAVDARAPLFADPRQETFRLVFGEADGVPGVAADLYGSVLSVQYSSAFCWDNAEMIEETLRSCLAARGVPATVTRSVDRAMFKREGIAAPEDGADATAAGGDATDSDGPPPPATAPEPITVRENGLPWRVMPGSDQKTGLYCDQRENRSRVAEYAAGSRMLDAFCYHGGFGLTALNGTPDGAAYVCFADRSEPALQTVVGNAALQGVSADRYETVTGDLFTLLREDAVPGGIASYDLIVLDPPKLVPTRQNLADGLRAYKDLHISVLRAMRPDTRLATFSCSGAVSAADFRRAVAWAAGDLRRTVTVEGVMTQAADHPVPLAFPEAEYLKGLMLHVQ
ncbi:MAG: class I SAM-dependent rRNA methyltransferase [Spirochaeta sp.]|nr:class I SAM-dependent rRNA methyltransferase [Spirochaeta sp.]